MNQSSALCDGCITRTFQVLKAQGTMHCLNFSHTKEMIILEGEKMIIWKMEKIKMQRLVVLPHAAACIAELSSSRSAEVDLSHHIYFCHMYTEKDQERSPYRHKHR